ncbi:MAG: glycosyltransferase family 4 protein [bacterium]|nr:glycosyltransferase family 4 protein [bacterium]
MKVLLYSDNLEMIYKSGLGRAIQHQKKALELAGVEYTLDKNDDFDILHINTYFIESYNFAKKAKKNGKKIVYHAHSTEEDFRNSFVLSNQVAPFFKKWIMACYKLGDVIITPTPYSKNILMGYGLEPPIYAISNGIEIKKFKKNIKLGQQFRKKYNYSKEDKVIVSIGMFIERKGIVDFVELAKRLPEYKFIWFGHTSLSTVSKNVRDAVTTKLDNLLFPGYVPSNEIMGALSGADLYIFPTYEETEGIVLIEAFACSINALIRDIGVFDGWLEDGVNVYKAKDIDEFEIKIKKILTGELPSLVKEGRKVAEERDLTIIGNQLKHVYDNVMQLDKDIKFYQE